MEVSEQQEENASEAKTTTSPFKKPLLVGKIGKLPKRFHQIIVKSPPENEEIEQTSAVVETVESDDNSQLESTKSDVKVVPYDLPSWSGLPQTDYNLEVLKNGAIIETINLKKQAFWLFGRLGNCDVCMQHPTISRYHAILQYRDENSRRGFYIYDLESTHGTFLNKNRLKPRSYVNMKVGHMLRLGCSTRTYILNGPDEDAEEESPLTVTELKQKREEELRQRQLERTREEEKRIRDEERGIDWGLGEDAEEETDLSENPFAQTNNEDLYLDNPKKALRGFFEREGLELEYDCSEQGMGQFVCKVELPLDDEVGRPIFAEVFHKGKKKEAVVQCALEACRILDRHGVLRQATHESKKRKPKNWEENDFYDSDDDTFLDRTGTVEKKRQMRMNAKEPQKAETYESLLEKEKAINEAIKKSEREIVDSQNKSNSEGSSSSETADPLDSYMMELHQTKPNKKAVNKLKSELLKLKLEHANVIKLVNIARPASLPPLVAQYKEIKNLDKKTTPDFGKRKKIKLQLTSTNEELQDSEDTIDDGEEIEEEEDDDEESKNIDEIEDNETENVQESQSVIENKVSESPEDDKPLDAETIERRKRKNQRRIQQKQQKAQIEKRKGYEEDAGKEDYNMWVPPSGQTGDGRTNLNEKYGY